MSLLDQMDNMEKRELYHNEMIENRRVFLDHRDSTTYSEILRVDMENGVVYIERRITEREQSRLRTILSRFIPCELPSLI